MQTIRISYFRLDAPIQPYAPRYIEEAHTQESAHRVLDNTYCREGGNYLLEFFDNDAQYQSSNPSMICWGSTEKLHRDVDMFFNGDYNRNHAQQRTVPDYLPS